MFDQMMFVLAVFALGVSFAALASTFGTRGVARAQLSLAYRLWGGRSPDEILAKRFKLFVLLVISLIAASTLIKQLWVNIPNFELIIPSLVVVGSFSLYCGSSKFWRYMTRYFGVVAIISVYIIYFVFEGFHSIYIFTWSGFLIVWLLGMKNKLSMFGGSTRLLWRTMLTTAAAIIIFDIFTGIIGGALLFPSIGIGAAAIGQIPFTLYHLTSLAFVPPLVGIAKMMVKVKVPVKVAVAAKAQVSAQERW